MKTEILLDHAAPGTRARSVNLPAALTVATHHLDNGIGVGVGRERVRDPTGSGIGGCVTVEVGQLGRDVLEQCGAKVTPPFGILGMGGGT
jgi:hypothetical protein